LYGQNNWSISTLQHTLLEYGYFDSISWTTIQRCLKTLDLKPHKMDYYLFCEDPDLVKKAKKICGLYLNLSPDWVLLCYDERTGIQALEREKALGIKCGYTAKQEFEYIRHGRKDLLAVFEVKTGKVFGKCYDKHRGIEFLDFLKKVRRRYKGKKLKIILDNLSTHMTPAVKEWLENQEGMIEFIFLPKHASWLNQIEIWFRELNSKCLKWLSVKNKIELQEKVMLWIKTYNKKFAHPYEWKYKGRILKNAA